MYAVEFVGKDALHGGHAWALARDGRDDYYLFIDESQVTEAMLEEAWAAYRIAATGPLPRQRVPA